MYNIALRITGDADAASDCAQEAFIRAHKALHQYDPNLPFGPWIFRIVTNASLNHVQRWHAHQTPVEELPEVAEPLESGPEASALRHEALSEVVAAMSERPRVFFDQQSVLPAGRTVADAQWRVGGPLQAIVPLQRGISDAARDAAALLLTLLLTASTLGLVNGQVVAVYRASLGDWRSQARVFAAGFIVLGLAVSTAALAWVVYLNS